MGDFLSLSPTVRRWTTLKHLRVCTGLLCLVTSRSPFSVGIWGYLFSPIGSLLRFLLLLATLTLARHTAKGSKSLYLAEELRHQKRVFIRLSFGLRHAFFFFIQRGAGAFFFFRFSARRRHAVDFFPAIFSKTQTCSRFFPPFSARHRPAVDFSRHFQQDTDLQSIFPALFSKTQTCSRFFPQFSARHRPAVDFQFFRRLQQDTNLPKTTFLRFSARRTTYVIFPSFSARHS